MCSGRAACKGSPRNETVPALGRSSPASRLISVDLPAPLVPMSAWISSRLSSSDTRSTATSPPKRRVSSRAASIVSATSRSFAPITPCLTGAGQSLGKQHHHHDHEATHQEQPVLGERREQVL